MDSFESIKADIISFLKKKVRQEESEDYKKAIAYFNETESIVTHLEKSLDGAWIEKAGYGVGTIRIWKGKRYKKISASPNRWVRVYNKIDRGSKNAFTRLLNKAEKEIHTPEEMLQLVLANRQRFVDDNGKPLDFMDRLNAVIDNKKYKSDKKAKPMDSKQVKKIHNKIEENKKKGKKVTPYEAQKQIDNEELDKKVKEINAATKEKNSKIYWIQDSHGNRMTNEDAKKKILQNIERIAKLEKEMEGNSKVDNFAREIKKRELENDNKYFIDLLTPEDRKEVQPEKKESNKNSAPDRIAYKIRRAYKDGNDNGFNFTLWYGDKIIKEYFKDYSEMKNYCKKLGNFYFPKELTINNYGGRYDTEDEKFEENETTNDIINKKEETKPVEKPAEKPTDYAAVQSKNTVSPTGEKIAIQKATVTDYHYNDAHPDAKMITIPASKEMLNAFKRLDTVIDHSVNWKKPQAYIRYFGVSGGYLYTTDGRQLKRAKVDGLDGLPENALYEAEIKDGNIVLKEQPNSGKYPAVERVIPKENNKTIAIDNKSLKNRIKELKEAKYFNSKVPIIDLDLKDGKLMIGNTVVGKAENYKGEDLKFRFNYNFLLNSLTKDSTSILNFNDSSNTGITNDGVKTILSACAISENTGDNIFMPLSADSNLTNPDEHIKEHNERGGRIKAAAMNSFKSALDNTNMKDVDKRLKDRALKYVESLSDDKVYSQQEDMTRALPLLHKILNDDKFISMGLKPEFGKVENSKYVSFRDKTGRSFSVSQMDNPAVAKFIKQLAADGVFGEMKKSDLRDRTSLENYVLKSISILKKSLIG